MNEYHKIDSVFKRDERGRFLIGEWSRPEFEYLADLPWQWTEKIDGTNIRIMWHPDSGVAPTVRFGGKTDNAQIPVKLLKYLQDEFTPAKFFAACLENDICLYGEGYGAGIQNGGLYSAEQKFILFDVKIGHWWLQRKDVEDIAQKLSIDIVPVYTDTLNQVIRSVEAVAKGMAGPKDDPWPIPRSSIGIAPIEGYVGTPLVPLFNRKGERIITKIKYKDFK